MTTGTAGFRVSILAGGQLLFESSEVHAYGELNIHWHLTVILGLSLYVSKIVSSFSHKIFVALVVHRNVVFCNHSRPFLPLTVIKSCILRCQINMHSQYYPIVLYLFMFAPNCRYIGVNSPKTLRF